MTFIFFCRKSKTYDTIPVTSPQLKNADGSYVQTANGGANTYTYTNGKWVCVTHTDTDKNHICDVCGLNPCSECVDTEPADHTCDICGKEKMTECSDGEDEDTLCDICGVNLCSHSEVTTIEKVLATCTVDGTKAYWTCETCGKSFSDEACTTEITDLEVWLADETETGGKLTALGHTYGEVTYTWTDHTACVATRTCMVCTEETEGHTETAEGVITSEDTTPATCKEAGVRTYTAAFDVDWAAQQTATEEIAIDETAHAWDNDCDTECNNGCGTIREITHNYDSVVTDPTCTVGGFTTHTCSVCGDSYTDSETAAAGCNYSDEWKMDADDHWHECSVCGEESEKAAHADGNNDHECDTCEYVMSECSFTVKGELKTAGTCMADAVYKANCSVCGAVSETETITGEKDSSNHTGNNHTENAEPADCTNAGYTGDTVCECGVTVATGTAIETTGHRNTTTTTVDATCTADGSVTVVCADCGATISTETIEATGHSYSTVVTAPTCDADGYTTYTCTCGDSYTGDTVTKLGHDYELTDFKPATCTEDGYETYTCKNDASHTYTTTLTKTGHTAGAEATCTTAQTCTVCNAELVAAKGHSWVDADCDTPKTCSVCQATEGTALGHTEVIDEAVAATCIETGLTAGSHCGTCGDVITAQEVIPATGHSYTVEQSRTAATCVATGSVVKKCATCDATTTETLPVDSSNHTGNNTVTGKVDADCENAGYTGDSVCECSVTVSVGETIPALGHDYELTDSKDATCTEDGYETYTCKNDASHTYNITVEAQGHSYETVTTAPTHTSGGFDTHTCGNCGDSYTDNATDALGHEYDEGVVTTAPTCTVAGVKTFTCGSCGNSYTEAVDALDHAWATMLTKGETTHWYECTREGCDEKNVETEHSYEWTTTQEASCFEDGSKSGNCDCGATATEVIPATGDHTYSETYTTENENHWRECTTEGCTAKTDEAECSGGTATCTAQAICTICQQPHGEVNADAHDLKTVSAQTATCTQIGWAEYQECQREGCEYSTYEEIPMLDHD